MVKEKQTKKNSLAYVKMLNILFLIKTKLLQASKVDKKKKKNIFRDVKSIRIIVAIEHTDNPAFGVCGNCLDCKY